MPPANALKDKWVRPIYQIGSNQKWKVLEKGQVHLSKATLV